MKHEKTIISKYEKYKQKYISLKSSIDDESNEHKNVRYSSTIIIGAGIGSLYFAKKISTN